jgi:hypothetical protein
LIRRWQREIIEDARSFAAFVTIRLKRDLTMTVQPAGAGSSRQNQSRAKDLAGLLSDLIEHWEKYPDNLDDQVRDITRATLADFMSWAESLFGSDHPIATTIRYLGSVGEYDRPQFPKDKVLTYRDALEYAVMLRSLIRSWLKNEVGLSDRQTFGGGSIVGNKPVEGRPYYSMSPAHKGKPSSICGPMMVD